MKGYMKPTWDVWCGCGNWINVGGERAVYRENRAIARGWKKLPKRSWTCPDCQKQIESKKSGGDDGNEGEA